MHCDVEVHVTVDSIFAKYNMEYGGEKHYVVTFVRNIHCTILKGVDSFLIHLVNELSNISISYHGKNLFHNLDFHISVGS